MIKHSETDQKECLKSVIASNYVGQKIRHKRRSRSQGTEYTIHLVFLGLLAPMDIHHTGPESQNSTSVKPYVGILEGGTCLVYSVGILEDGVCQTCVGILETEPVKLVCGNSRVWMGPVKYVWGF